MEYVYFDVDKIKEFVFDSFKPREVAGASELIKSLDYDSDPKKQGKLFAELNQAYSGLNVIYSRGGGGLITTDNDNGVEICEWLEKNYPKHAKEGSLTAVSHNEKDFKTAFSILGYKLRKKKSDKYITQSLDYVEFKNGESDKCNACGKRPSKGNFEEIAGEQIPYCFVCSHKRSLGKKLIGAESLEDIIKRDKTDENKNVLIIYGDLNEAGAHLSALKDEGELQDFSDTVFETLSQTRKQIETVLEQKRFKYLMPVVGGDDVIIFTHPAAFELIKDKLFAVEKELQQKLAKPVKMNFSFLVAKHNFPIYHLFNISEELLKKTKDRYYQDEPDNRRTHYGFLWLMEGNYRPSKQDVYLDSDFYTLFKVAKIIYEDSSIHRSSLYQILEMISNKSSVEKEMDMEYFLVRHRELQDLIFQEYIETWIKKDGEKMELTYDVLEDIIRMGDLLYEPFNKGKEGE